MRWSKKFSHENREERVISKFLWFPLRLRTNNGNYEWRWLEEATIIQFFSYLNGGKWLNLQWGP
jgi:hypothetical protein